MYLLTTDIVCPSVGNILINGQNGSDPVLLLIFMKTYKKRVRQNYSENLLHNLCICVKGEGERCLVIIFSKMNKRWGFFLPFPKSFKQNFKNCRNQYNAFWLLIYAAFAKVAFVFFLRKSLTVLKFCKQNKSVYFKTECHTG